MTTESPPGASPPLLPGLIDKKFAAEYFTCPSLVDRMLWATRHTSDKWLEIVINAEGNPNKRTLIYSGSLLSALERLRRGEEPPRIGNLGTPRHPPQRR